MDKFRLSRNMGFITGPLLLLLGIMGYMKKNLPALSIMMMILGVIRIGLTIYTVMMQKKENQE